MAVLDDTSLTMNAVGYHHHPRHHCHRLGHGHGRGHGWLWVDIFMINIICVIKTLIYVRVFMIFFSLGPWRGRPTVEDETEDDIFPPRVFWWCGHWVIAEIAMLSMTTFYNRLCFADLWSTTTRARSATAWTVLLKRTGTFSSQVKHFNPIVPADHIRHLNATSVKGADLATYTFYCCFFLTVLIFLIFSFYSC